MTSRRVGVAMAGGNPVEGKQQDDGFYSTPEDATWALLDWLESSGVLASHVPPGTPFHECCCGDGRMAKIISMRHPVIATDLVDRGYGDEHGPTCDMTHAGPRSSVLMTNPPFFLADAMLKRILDTDFAVVAMLLKTTYFNTSGREPGFHGRPPAFNLGLTWRPDFRGLGRPTMCVNWFVWLRGNTELPRYDVLRRPKLPEGVMPKIVLPPEKRLPRKPRKVPVEIVDPVARQAEIPCDVEIDLPKAA